VSPGYVLLSVRSRESQLENIICDQDHVPLPLPLPCLGTNNKVPEYVHCGQSSHLSNTGPKASNMVTRKLELKKFIEGSKGSLCVVEGSKGNAREAHRKWDRWRWEHGFGSILVGDDGPGRVLSDHIVTENTGRGKEKVGGAGDAGCGELLSHRFCFRRT
jgi:hypothetical protein